MDCCKAISLGAKYDGDIWADFWARPGVIDFLNCCRLVLSSLFQAQAVNVTAVP